MKKIKILFVCHGNICRSPMAEGIFNKIIEREHISNIFEIDSAGIIGFHQGELPDSRMCSHAAKRFYKLIHRSRPVISADFLEFDMLIGMDEDNIAGLKRICSHTVQEEKIFRMTDFCENRSDTFVPDPYYGGDKGFENVIDLLEDACEGLYHQIQKNHLL